MKSFLQDRSGASVVEFALLLAPFLLLLFGVIEVSRALWTRQAAQDIATATARCIGVMQAECTGATAFDKAKTTKYAQGLARSYAILLDDAGTSLKRDTECDGLPGAAEARVKARFDSVFPFEKVIDFEVGACFFDWSTI
jgi:Flp pilus assembly protein TadG